MNKIVSIFGNGHKQPEKGFSPEDIEQQKREFELRGGKVQVLSCVPRGDQLPNDYTRGRINAIKKQGKKRANCGNDFDPPPEAA